MECVDEMPTAPGLGGANDTGVGAGAGGTKDTGADGAEAGAAGGRGAAWDDSGVPSASLSAVWASCPWSSVRAVSSVYGPFSHAR